MGEGATSSPASSVQLTLHLAGILNYLYCIHFQLLVVDIPDSLSKTRNRFGGPWKYLTFLNLWLQLGFHVVALLNCLVGTSSLTRNGRSNLQKARDFLFATSAFPIGVFVSAMFWGLFAINRELVFPERFDAYIPPLQNHLLHTSVFFLQLLELCTARHFYPRRRRAGMAVTGVVCMAYLVWLCVIAHFGGFWVYPVLKVLNSFTRSLFILGSCMLGGALYLMGEKLNDAVSSKSHLD